VGQHRICTVSFIDPEGITHAVDVTAATLYEAAVLAVAEFRRVGLFEVRIGPGTRLRVAVKQPEATHEIQFGKLQEWLDDGARNSNEQVTKARLRKALRG
jgi:hypothetical protein